MTRKYVGRVLFVWVGFFTFSVVVGEIAWDKALLPTLAGAALFATLFAIKFLDHADQDIEVVEQMHSPDGIVVATIEDWPSEKEVLRYRCTVKSNYPDKVYFKEGEFDTLEEAQAWLETTYAQELVKHQERIQQT